LISAAIASRLSSTFLTIDVILDEVSLFIHPIPTAMLTANVMYVAAM
jgi:hypothetical protein